MKKQYLGDGVFVTYGDHGITLTTENGISTTNTIVLDYEIVDSLMIALEHSPFAHLLKKAGL